jgi:hypothetical protein
MKPTVLAGAFAMAAGLFTAALAHHGWSWASQDQTEMSGTIREIYIGPPHPALKIETPNNGLWTVDLGNPRQTAAAGFDESSAKTGDAVVVRGHKSLNAEERRIKAVRITIDGKRFDFYPERIVED